jgi:DNA primase large subunit
LSQQKTIVIDARKYPFLASYADILRARFGVSELAVVLSRKDLSAIVVERLRHAIEHARVPPPRDSLHEEVVSFYGALAVAAKLGDKWVTSRLALAEADRSYELMQNEPGPVIEAIAKAVGLRSFQYLPTPLRVAIARAAAVTIYRIYEFRIHFVEYVTHARRLLGDPSWKPVNLPVKDGYVYLDTQKAVRLVKEVVMDYVEQLASKLEGEDVPDDLVKEVESFVRERRRPKLETGRSRPRVKIEKGIIVEEAFPPCMADILERAKRGEHLSHHERFAIATFMLQIGADVEQVVSVFKNLPDFNEKITRYQVEHLAGLRGSMKKYMTYNCDRMRSLGLCRADCGARNPVPQYYRLLARLVGSQRTRTTSADGAPQ